MQTKVSEIFLSHQGEGPFVGSSQLFVRFYGCNLHCTYCDTPLESYKSFSREGLFSSILDFGDEYNELTLTGGEPLLHAKFLEEFLPLFRKHKCHKVYLETNGTLCSELERVIDHIDIVAMDFKLPSSTCQENDLWNLHQKFTGIASAKELIVKAVVTDRTVIDDIKKMADILKSIDTNFVPVLQPVTPVNEFSVAPDTEMILYFQKFLEKETQKEVAILGQMHKFLGIK